MSNEKNILEEVQKQTALISEIQKKVLENERKYQEIKNNQKEIKADRESLHVVERFIEHLKIKSIHLDDRDTFELSETMKKSFNLSPVLEWLKQRGYTIQLVSTTDGWS